MVSKTTILAKLRWAKTTTFALSVIAKSRKTRQKLMSILSTPSHSIKSTTHLQHVEAMEQSLFGTKIAKVSTSRQRSSHAPLQHLASPKMANFSPMPSGMIGAKDSKADSMLKDSQSHLRSLSGLPTLQRRFSNVADAEN